MIRRTVRTRLRWLRASLVAALAWTGATGCGNLTAGGLTAEASVVVSGDAQSPAPSPRMSVEARPAPAPPAPPALSSHEDEPEGEVRAKFMLFLISETGSALQLGSDDIEVEVDLQGQTEWEAVRSQLIPAVRYTELQIVFTEIRAEVSRGLIINGQEVTGEVRVELDDVTLLVPRAIDLDVPGGSRVEILLDLNAPAWLAAVDTTTVPYSIDASVFADLIDVVIR
ncbi:MAG TPA: hypothetical protein VLA09_04940 [Longimicrobiales bacterium]|nr:hypothetical protein [Longimicrobiales bacterium]